MTAAPPPARAGCAAGSPRRRRAGPPVRAGPAIGHPDAARVDDQTPVDQPREGHMGVPAYDRGHLRAETGQGLQPALRGGVSTRTTSLSSRGVPWQHTTAPVPATSTVTGVGEPGQQRDLVRSQLPGRPAVDGRPQHRAEGPGPGLTNSRSAFPRTNQHPVPEPGQAIEHLHRLGACRVVAGHHHQVRVAYLRLCEHRFQCRQHPMDVGEQCQSTDRRSPDRGDSTWSLQVVGGRGGCGGPRLIGVRRRIHTVSLPTS